MRLALLGAPGSGKGTQGRLLSSRFGIAHIAVGGLIRSEIEKKTVFGVKVAGSISAGEFAPDEDVLHLLLSRVSQVDCRRGYILDGFPRDVNQANAWEELAGCRNEPIDSVIDLKVEHDILVDRLSGRLICPVDGETYHVRFNAPQVQGRCNRHDVKLVRRPDDEPSAVERRLKLYEAMTLPVGQFYAKQGRLITVNGNGCASEVEGRIVSRLDCTKNEFLGV